MSSCNIQISSCLLTVILLLLSCSEHTQVSTENSDPTLVCMPSVRVRNTVWKAPVMKTLKINCTMETDSQCGADSLNHLSVSWCKINDENDCKPLNHSTNTVTAQRNITDNKHMSFLVFLSLSLRDAGLYRCRLHQPETISHTINVTVTDAVTLTDAVHLDSEDVSNKTAGDHEQKREKHFSVVYCAGTVVTLVLVILVLFKIINSKDSEGTLGDKDLLTTVSYEAAEESSLQD